MQIKILGAGCPKCKKLAELARRAVDELGITAEVSEIHDVAEIARYTYMTPALVIGEELVMTGLQPYPKVREAIAARAKG